MPTHFRRRPSHRKARNPVAKWLVLGHPAADIHHHGRTAHLLPVKSGDHRLKYSAGQRLAVKEFVPGPTECHIILTSVDGPTNHYTLGQVDYQTARSLGHIRVDVFRLAWVRTVDTLWCENHDSSDETLVLERFDHRWADKLAWLLRFRLDIAAAPHLLAARSDELYVENAAMALKDEMPALTEEEWKTHIGPQSRFREQDRLAERRRDREALGWTVRLDAAKQTARAKGYDIRSEVRCFERLMAEGREDKAMRQLGLLEGRVFPVAA